MTEKIPEADIILIDRVRAAKRHALPQRVPQEPLKEFTLPEPKPRLKLIHGIDILSNCMEIELSADTPIYNALQLQKD